jgi:hypothetical protein
VEYVIAGKLLSCWSHHLLSATNKLQKKKTLHGLLKFMVLHGLRIRIRNDLGRLDPDPHWGMRIRNQGEKMRNKNRKQSFMVT